MSSTQGIVEQGGATRAESFSGGPAGSPADGEGRSRRPMTIPEILAWADEHRRLTGRWPRIDSEPKGLPIGETWHAVHSALRMGLRGLEGGSSLAQVLAEHRGLRGPLTPERILAWADAHHAATGQWPKRTSGRVRGVERETWESLDFSLLQGRRGLPGGSSLARLLAESRPVRNVHTMPRLTVEQVLAWADAYHAKTGRWPRAQSGRVADAPGETWGAVESAVFQGLRGLPGGITLAQLLAERRGAPAIQTSRPLTVDQILAWADAHHAATGHWPVEDSRIAVRGSEGKRGTRLAMASSRGLRGLQAGSSAGARLFGRALRGAGGNPKGLPPRDHQGKSQTWAVAYHSAAGRWPTAQSRPDRHCGRPPAKPGRRSNLRCAAGTAGCRGDSRWPESGGPARHRRQRKSCCSLMTLRSSPSPGPGCRASQRRAGNRTRRAPKDDVGRAPRTEGS